MATSQLPPDDLARTTTIARPDTDASLPHLSVVGDTYTILIPGEATQGLYCLIDMFVAPDGGPPPHRHDFEEMFHLLEGELTFTFRGKQTVLHAGESINIPSNAPHAFKNTSGKPARTLCMTTPAILDAQFRETGLPVATRTSPPPKLSPEAGEKLKAKAVALAPKFRTEILPMQHPQ